MMQWLAPSQNEPDWQLVDEEGNLLGEVRKGALGWNYTAYKDGKVIAGGGAVKSLSQAKSFVNRAHGAPLP